MFDLTPHTRIFVAGHRGLVGSAVLRRLGLTGSPACSTASRDQLDLRDQAAVNYWFRANRPECVLLVAGTVGGILANSTRPAEFIYDNMMIHATVVHAAHLYAVQKLLYLGSSCIYPRDCAQPMSEGALLSVPSRPRTSPTRWPRSPASSSARPIGGSTGATSSPPCPRTSTARTTTSISRARTCSRPHSQVPRREARRSERGGDLGVRDAPAGVLARGRPRRRVPVPAAGL